MVRVTIRLLAALIVAGSVAGCVDWAEVEQLRERTSSLRDRLASEEAAWRGRLDALPADDPLRPDAEVALDAVRAGRSAADAAVAGVDRLIETARRPVDPLGNAVGAVAPLIPGPWRVPLLLGGALVGAVLRAAQLKRATASIARGIQKAMERDGEFASAFARHADSFRVIQTGAARRIVDEATGDRFMVRLPI